MRYYFLFFLFILSIQGCQDPCKKTECGHGTCVNGGCNCDPGWQTNNVGVCEKQLLCYGKDCVNGNCDDLTGDCKCNVSWLKDSLGKCTIKDSCYSKYCGTHGTCNSPSGDCICENGYEKNAAKQCSITGANKFVGSWQGDDVCSGFIPNDYTLYINKKSNTVDKLIITGLGNLQCNGVDLQLIGTISRDSAGFYTKVNLITPDCANYTIDTTVTRMVMTDGRIYFRYKIDSNGYIYDCNVTLKKN